MTKDELIKMIARRACISKPRAARIVIEVAKELEKSGGLKIMGFGTFPVVKRKARKGRQAQIGRAIKFAAKKIVKFKTSKKFGPFDDDTESTGPKIRKR